MRYRSHSNRAEAPAFFEGDSAIRPFHRPPLTLAELDAAHASFLEVARYVDEKAVSTLRTQRSVYLRFRKYVLAGDPDEISSRIGDITGWLVWLRKSNDRLSKVTINGYFRSLRPFFRYLEQKGYLLDPFRSIPAPRLPKDRPPRALKPQDAVRVLRAASEYPWRNAFSRARAVAIIAIMLLGGLRKGEVLRLQLEDVDLASGLIAILESKGGKSRTVYMPPELRMKLAAYLDARTNRRCTAFFVSKNDQPLSESQFRRLMQRIGQHAGVHLFAHALRHSYVTLLLKSRLPLHLVQSLAGHADLETTQRYVAIWDDEKRAAVQRVHLTRR